MAGRFAGENLELLRRAGLFALTVPSEQGGLGAQLGETIETLRILAHGSPSTALMLTMHTSILANYLADPFAIPESERQHYLDQRSWAWDQACRGAIFGVANSEPGAGGDVHNSTAEVSEKDGRLVLNGVKSFASMGIHADFYMAAGRDARGQVEYYLVERTASSPLVRTPWDATGMRSSESVVLRFEDSPVVGYFGYRGLLDGANNRHWSTLSFTAICVGIAESLLEEVTSQSRSALQQVETVDLHLAVQASSSFLRHVISIEPPVIDGTYKRLVRDCKTFVARSLADKAATIFISQGGGAYRFGSPVSRKLRDLLAGPSLRPPLASTYEEIWKELSGGKGQ